jgi:hypothetical protein
VCKRNRSKWEQELAAIPRRWKPPVRRVDSWMRWSVVKRWSCHTFDRPGWILSTVYDWIRCIVFYLRMLNRKKLNGIDNESLS